MDRRFMIAGAFSGGIAVALGAFGAHGLERITQDEKILHGFQTGVQYQMYHALALLAVALIGDKLPVKQVKWAGWFFIGGIILFSGSLYLLTFLKISDSPMTKIAGPLTPLGGLLFIAGWIMLIYSALRHATKQ